MTQLRAPGCPGSSHADDRWPVEQHREHVVGRLLAAGLSAHLLITLLPDFRPIVHRVLQRD